MSTTFARATPDTFARSAAVMYAAGVRSSRRAIMAAAHTLVREPWRIARLLYPTGRGYLDGMTVDQHLAIVLSRVATMRRLGRTNHYSFDPGRLSDLLACALALRWIRRRVGE